jgi:hypothetical protein
MIAAMKRTETQNTTTARRVWTIRHRDGKELKVEVNIANPRLEQTQEAMRRLTSECLDVEVSEHDE